MATVAQSSIYDTLEVLHKSGVRTRYENFIGGKWVPPTTGRYFTSYSPINQEPICEFARSGAADIERALDAAHAVKEEWGHTSPAVRSALLLKIADVLEQNLETLATAETLDNGKPIRETRNADVPLVVDHLTCPQTPHTDNTTHPAVARAVVKWETPVAFSKLTESASFPRPARRANSAGVR